MAVQAFWNLTNFNDTIDKIDNISLGLSVYDLVKSNTAYKIVEDDTSQEVLITESENNITFDMIDEFNSPYQVTSVKATLWGGRPTRPS